MSISLIDIVLSVILIIIVFFYLLKKGFSHRGSKKIWKMYDKISERSDLEIKDSLRLISTWPNLFGEFDGRRVYIHPDRGKGKKKPPKTVFGVETKIGVEDDLIITTSESNAPEDAYNLDISSLNKRKYEVYSMSKLNEEKFNEIFSKEVAGKINDMIEDDREDFRGLIFESGLAMFSKFEIDIDKEECLDTLEKLADIVEQMEDNASELEENFVNPRLSQLSQGTKSTNIKSAVMVLLIGLVGFLLYRTYINFSFLFMNIAIAAIAISLLNLYSTATTAWKYQ